MILAAAVALPSRLNIEILPADRAVDNGIATRKPRRFAHVR
jgi:hypothetical protein